MGIKPELGSPLESMYQILFQLRQEQTFFSQALLARAILDAPLQTVEGAEIGDDLSKISEQYIDSMFPNYKSDNKKKVKELQEALHEWVSKVSDITVTPLPSMTDRMKQARRAQKGRQQLETYNRSLSNKIQRRLK
jgi:hypothetical protein